MSKSLFISYDIANKEFVYNAKSMRITDIGVDVMDINLTIEKIKNTSIEDIDKAPFFNKSMWDLYAEDYPNVGIILDTCMQLFF